MTSVRVNELISVAGQPDAAGFVAFAGEGFAAVINARPDGEEPGQPRAGDIEAEGVHMLSTGGMMTYARERAGGGGTAIMATETGMLHPLRMAAPDVDFIAANERASCANPWHTIQTSLAGFVASPSVQ